jgi:hypothetical protein
MLFSFTFMNKKHESKSEKPQIENSNTQTKVQEQITKKKLSEKKLVKLNPKKNLEEKISLFFKSNLRQCPTSIIENSSKFEWTGQYGRCDEKIYQHYFKNQCYGNVLDVGIGNYFFLKTFQVPVMESPIQILMDLK